MSKEENNNKTDGLVKCGDVRVMTIIGQIEGHTLLAQDVKSTKYENLIPILTNIELDDEAKGVLFILNTVGGDVEAGLALAELIRGMKKPTVSLVLGGGHSIGVPLAVAADHSFIAKTATMTVHPIRTSGLMINVAQTFRYYEKMQNRVEDFVCENSSISKQKESVFSIEVNRFTLLIAQRFKLMPYL